MFVLSKKTNINIIQNMGNRIVNNGRGCKKFQQWKSVKTNSKQLITKLSDSYIIIVSLKIFIILKTG